MTLLVEHARTDKFSNREFFDHIAVCGLGTTSTKPKPNPFDRLKFLGNHFPTGFQGSDPAPPISFHLKLLEEEGMKDESVEVEVKEEESFKFKDAERKCSRPGDIVYHEGDLHLSQYKWQFGKTPFYSDDVYNLDPDLEALDSATAAQPNIAGKLKNNMI